MLDKPRRAHLLSIDVAVLTTQSFIALLYRTHSISEHRLCGNICPARKGGARIDFYLLSRTAARRRHAAKYARSEGGMLG